ncbi:hypothetical protein PR202_ga20892 [Eleusine coracana subsp. coracana]|uniref:VQ domain-containing protein n=1 Tax=Eleusine coracana subsp. coracana TaxID=191504 RepID=A0AAV5CZY7_ELECO|nr:hypothetical protein QOZ80_8AG0629620 [Eleusine coracana subsp. coracana]GJN03443.1 hypothetical protein PR202_ga20892 [Eleusine coracana subsp. coracana]
MDSGNSGSLSLQSSSGGDDEFDSRCGGVEDSSPLSALLRPPPGPSFSSAVLPGFGGSSSFYGIHDLATPPLSHAAHWPSPTTRQLPATGDGASSTAPPQSSGGHGVQPPASAGDQPAQQAPARGSRKRARASRRAPTTVLTTDTSNFRAMVQEFTGVPAPPFASARSSRFDHLFPSRSSAAGALALPYLLRPFAHKLQPPFIANKAIATSAAPRTTVASGDSYQHLASAPAGALGMPDHGNYLSFQSGTGGQLDGSARTRYPKTFHAAGFSGGLAAMSSEATRHLRPRPHGGDELSGLVGAASVSAAERNASTTTTVIAGGAAATTTPGAAPPGIRRAPRGVESSWICTSE